MGDVAGVYLIVKGFRPVPILDGAAGAAGAEHPVAGREVAA